MLSLRREQRERYTAGTPIALIHDVCYNRVAKNPLRGLETL